jgi:hypothetical protein
MYTPKPPPPPPPPPKKKKNEKGSNREASLFVKIFILSFVFSSKKNINKQFKYKYSKKKIQKQFSHLCHTKTFFLKKKKYIPKIHLQAELEIGKKWWSEITGKCWCHVVQNLCHASLLTFSY